VLRDVSKHLPVFRQRYEGCACIFQHGFCAQICSGVILQSCFNTNVVDELLKAYCTHCLNLCTHATQIWVTSLCAFCSVRMLTLCYYKMH